MACIEAINGDTQSTVVDDSLNIDQQINESRSKIDKEYEAKVITWIEAVIEEKLGTNSLWEALKSGVVLCRLVNKIEPGAIKLYTNTPKMHPLLERENINFYLEACWRLGVDSRDIFITSDLHNARYMKSVLRNLTALSHLAAKFETIQVEPIGPVPNPLSRYSRIYLSEHILQVGINNTEIENKKETESDNIVSSEEKSAESKLSKSSEVKIAQVTEQLEKARNEIRQLKKSNFTMQRMSISVPHLHLPSKFDEISKLNLELSQIKQQLSQEIIKNKNLEEEFNQLKLKK